MSIRSIWTFTVPVMYLVVIANAAAQWEEPCVEPFCPDEACDDSFLRDMARERWYKNTDCGRQREIETELAYFVPGQVPSPIDCGNEPTKICRIISSDTESAYRQLAFMASVYLEQECELALIDLECGTSVFQELERIKIGLASEETEAAEVQTF